VETLGRANGIRSLCIFGGRAMGPQISAVKAGPQVIIGTPGRVLDLLKQGVLNLGRVNYVVLDEADEMLDRGFAPDVERILGFVPRERQTALFSATVPEWVQGTAAKYLNNPAMVQIDTRPEDVPKIEHIIYDVPEGQKLPVLRVLLDGRGDESVLVFGRTKHGVKKLARQLVALGYPAAALQGNLSQNARDAVMADFRSGRVPILLATNVAARGLDVEHIGMVINYELPETTDLLTHRVGRTGRMGREGDAVTLLMPSDESKWRQLQRSLRVRIPRKAWTGDLPAVPASIDAFPLYPKREERGSRSERPMPAQRSAQPIRQRSSASAPSPSRRPERPERTERPAAMSDRARLQPERIAARPATPINPERFRFVASRDEDQSYARGEVAEREPSTTSAPGLLPPMLSTQVGALLSRYQETGTVATPVDVPLTRRAPMRARREERVVTEDANAATTPESRSERARTFGRSGSSADTPATGDATTGVITKIVKARGFGFLRDGSGTERFFHRNDVSGADFDTLTVSQSVRFTPDPTASGPRPIARAVEPIAS
ncbi:MAG: helicase-related protein, partial [Thermomicrobiales bacterium]